MSYFLSSQNLKTGQELNLEGEEAGHVLLSRRMKIGECFNLQGPDGKRFTAEILQAAKRSLRLKILTAADVPAKPRVKVTLLQSFVSERILDIILQKATELGAEEIILFNSQNTAVKLTAEMFKKKYQRWQKILWESAKQSDRVQPPGLDFENFFDSLPARLEKFNIVFLTDPVGGKISEPNGITDRAVLVGPEGGFTKKEQDEFKTLKNLKLLSLSPNILRAETAAIAALAVVLNC